jgi:hypothetical protein
MLCPMKTLLSFLLISGGIVAEGAAGDGLTSALATSSKASASLFAVPSPEELLQDVLRNPGEYRQICGFVTAAAKVPLPIYDSALQSEFHLSEAKLALLKARRAEVLPALNKYLEEIAPNQFTVPLAEIIVGLDAVEALPVLLRVDEAFTARLAKMPPLPAEGNFTKESLETWRVTIAEREVLSVVLQLLRGQKFQPLLDSGFEKIYATAIKERASQEDLREIKTPADAAAKNMKWLKFDPIYEVPLGYLSKKTEIEVTPEVRARVRGLAEQFVKTVPPEKWLVNAN